MALYKNKPIVLDNIPFVINRSDLYKKLHLDSGTNKANHIDTLIDEAQAIGKPRIIFKESYIDRIGHNSIHIDGIKITSSILRNILEKKEKVYPHIITCGIELDEWSAGINDLFYTYCAEEIKTIVLNSAIKFFNDYLLLHYQSIMCTINPGSLKDWPADEQGILFKILCDSDTCIVTMTDNYMIIPVKSVSGISFPTEKKYETCHLCQAEDCPDRLVPYEVEGFKDSGDIGFK